MAIVIFIFKTIEISKILSNLGPNIRKMKICNKYPNKILLINKIKDKFYRIIILMIHKYHNKM